MAYGIYETLSLFMSCAGQVVELSLLKKYQRTPLIPSPLCYSKFYHMMKDAKGELSSYPSKRKRERLSSLFENQAKVASSFGIKRKWMKFLI